MNIFVENNKSGIEHMLINRVIVKLFKTLKNEESRIFCSESLFNDQNMSDFFDKNNLIALNVYRPHQRFIKVFSEFYFFLRLLTIWRSLISNQSNHFVFTSLYPTSHFILRFISKYIRAKVTVVLHSEVSFLYEADNYNISSATYWMKKAFRRPAPLFNYVVLGDHIDVSPFIPIRNVIHINHPIESFIHDFTLKNLNTTPIFVGHIGVVSKIKRSDLFFDISKKFFADSRIRFVCAGSVSSELHDMKHSNVEADFSGRYLSNNDMDSLLRKMSFSVFTYGDLYSHVASGAILEAVRYGIPILCLRNSYFSFLKDNNIVFFEMYDDVESISRRIEVILNSGLCMRTMYEEGIEIAREYFSFEESLIRFKNFYV